MGCCQITQSSLEDQITLEPLPKQDQFINSLKVPKGLSPGKLESFKIFPNPSDQNSFYLIHSLISSNALFSRFFCVHSPSNQYHDLLLFNKSEMSETEILNLFQNCEKLSNFTHEHLVRVFSVSETEDFICVFTEVCGERTLKEILDNNRIPIAPALTLAHQIMQGLFKFQQIGLSGRSLTENDVFLIRNSLKVSISATILKDCDLIPTEIQESCNAEVWCLGVILLKLLSAPSQINEIGKGLEKLKKNKVNSQDLGFLRKMLRSEKKRPLLQEVIQYDWSSCEKCHGVNRCEFGIEKIYEECESLCVASSSWLSNEERSDCQESFDGKPKGIEKSTALQTMESLVG